VQCKKIIFKDPGFDPQPGKNLNRVPMEQHAFKNVNNRLYTNIFSYLETSGGQSYNPHSNVNPFYKPELVRNLWQLKTAVFLCWCLIRAVPFSHDCRSLPNIEIFE
jgi:hypothetical protein